MQNESGTMAIGRSPSIQPHARTLARSTADGPSARAPGRTHGAFAAPSLALPDPIDIAISFADEVVAMLGAVGVVLEIVAPAGERFVVSRGTPSGLVESIAPMLSPNRTGRPDGRIDVMEDIDRAPELAGTLLHESLRRAGVRGWFSMVLATDGENSYGTLVVFVPDGAAVGEEGRRATQRIMRRLLLELDRNWLAASVSANGARFEAILNSLPDAVAIVAPDGRVSAVNAICAEFLAMQPEAVIGRSFTEIFGIEVTAHASCELMMRRGDGAQVSVELSARPIGGGHGSVVTMRDITRSRAAEARLREADRLAMIGTIAAGLGHDMNNVLLPVRAHLNAIGASRGRMRAGQLEMHLSQVRAGLSYLQNLADSLHGLALDPESEVDGGGLTDLCAWWKKSQPILEKTLHRRAQLDSFVDESTPEVGAPAHALTRALLNLLVNAAEAMPEGRPQSACRVLVRIRSAEGAAVIEVTDNGSGMTDEVRRRAFDVFYTTKTRGLGTGLGLPLVRRVVERAGGSVEVESRVGLGTTVRLRLPAVDRELETVHPTAHVRLEDGRCAAIIRGYLDMFGVAVDAVQSVEDADMLVADADYTSVDDARRWCASRDPGMLVLVGEPLGGELAELRNLGVTVIRDGTDIRAIEQGLVGALRLKEETKNERE